MKLAVTTSGLQKMEDELVRLKGKEMRDALEALSEAREKGDISENSEYDVARENINMLNIKIGSLEEKIRNCVIVYKDDINTDTVQLFTTVQVKNMKTKKEHSFHIVTDDEIDARNGKISHNSPIAKGLIGKSKGERVQIDVPAGKVDFKIVDITL